MNPKVLIILVVILVILFVVGTGANVVNSNSNNPPNLKQDWLSAFGNLFAAHIHASDLTLHPSPPDPPGCSFQQATNTFTIPAASFCTFTVNSSKAEVRKLVIRIVSSGTAAAIVVAQTDPYTGGNDQQTSSGTDSTPPKDLTIYKDDGQPGNLATLIVQCTSGTACAVQLA